MPLFKLGVLLIRTLSKPVANAIKVSNVFSALAMYGACPLTCNWIEQGSAPRRLLAPSIFSVMSHGHRETSDRVSPAKTETCSGSSWFPKHLRKFRPGELFFMPSNVSSPLLAFPIIFSYEQELHSQSLQYRQLQETSWPKKIRKNNSDGLLVNQFYHRWEVKLNVQLMGMTARTIKPLDEATAVKTGAEILGEGIFWNSQKSTNACRMPVRYWYINACIVCNRRITSSGNHEGAGYLPKHNAGGYECMHTKTCIFLRAFSMYVVRPKILPWRQLFTHVCSSSLTTACDRNMTFVLQKQYIDNKFLVPFVCELKASHTRTWICIAYLQPRTFSYMITCNIHIYAQFFLVHIRCMHANT